ncbi:MAG: matrixin family metalloprotease [Acidobacteriota bacterium]
MRRLNPTLVFLAVLAFSVSSQPSALEPPSRQRPIRWPTRIIKIALSTSLTESSTSIVAGSDVKGALQRALDTWSSASGIKFVVSPSNATSISPAGAGDGFNLITVAPTAENLAIFTGGNNAARTRVLYDQVTGEISEADIVINPYPRSAEGAALLFSTDGTPGTYDLESTFAHEIGHVLGLNHSNVIAATMQETQGINGTFGMPAIDERSLSEVDRVAVRALYGPCENLGMVNGKVLNDLQGRNAPASGAHVWIEAIDSGRVIASSVVAAGGRFNIGCLPAGQYRAVVENVEGQADDSVPGMREPKLTGRQKILRSTEISSFLNVSADTHSPLSFLLAPVQSTVRTLRPRFFGINGDLSTVPVTVAAGSLLRLYVGGPGVDQVSGSGLLVSSPYVTVDPASLKLQPGRSTPVISFDVTIAADAPPGDYSLRLQSKSGQLAYLVGAITVNPTH